jgi:hypothetical protein
MITKQTVITGFDELKFVDCYDANGSEARVLNVYFPDGIKSFLLGDHQSYTINEKMITLGDGCPEVILTFKFV